jgi:hypothetical protein
MKRRAAELKMSALIVCKKKDACQASFLFFIVD